MSQEDVEDGATGVGEGSMGRAGCAERRSETGERGWRRVCRSSIGRFSPRSAVSPVRQQQLSRTHRRLHPPLERADGLG